MGADALALHGERASESRCSGLVSRGSSCDEAAACKPATGSETGFGLRAAGSGRR